MNCHPTPVTNRFARKRQKDPEIWKRTLQKRLKQDFTLQLLAKFQNKLKGIKEKAQEGTSEEKKAGEEKNTTEEEDDELNGDDWLGHKLHFEDQRPVLARDASTKGDDWFDIYDPRNPLNQRKREKGMKEKPKK